MHQASQDDELWNGSDDEFWNKKKAEGFGNLEDSDDYDHKWEEKDEEEEEEEKAFTYICNNVSNIM